MLVSRRTALQMGAALAVVPWLSSAPAAAGVVTLFPSGSSSLDDALGGGVRGGSLIVVLDPDASAGGHNGLIARMARANGVPDAHTLPAGATDMLSLMQRRDGQCTGCLLLNSPEPITDKELADAARDPKARDAFLARWFQRSREVVRESGGIMAIRVRAEPAPNADWYSIPDYVLTADERVVKHP